MGLFVTIEGVEGCGKTTIGKMIVDKLISDGYEVIYTREPGGIEIAEQDLFVLKIQVGAL